MATSPAPDAAAPPGMCPGIAVLGGGDGSGDGDGSGSGGGDGSGGDGGGGASRASGDEKEAQGAPDYDRYPECGYASHPVDVVTGRAFTHPITDLELPGPLPLEFRRMYSSKMASRDVGLGHGWGHTFGWRIEVRRLTIRVWNEQGIAVDFPMIAAGSEIIGPWGWLLRRDAEGFMVDADDGVFRLFSAVDEQGKRYRLDAIEDRNRNRISLTYEDGRLVEVVDSAGRIIRVVPTKEGRIQSIQVKNAVAQGQWIAFGTYAYDDRGNMVSATDADGFTARYEYDDQHRLTADTDRTGLCFHFIYDAEGRCVESWGDYPGKKDPSLADDLPKVLADGVTPVKGIHHCKFDYMPGYYSEVADSTQVRRFFGNKHGTLEKSVEGGAVTTATYREDGHILSRTDAMGARTCYERDARGRLLKVTDPLVRVTTVARNKNGLPVQIVDPAGGVTTIERDACGNALLLAEADGTATTFQRDTRGLVVDERGPTGARTMFQHDEQGNALFVTQPNGGKWQFTHDFLGRLLSCVDPEGAETRYAYSTRGDLISITDALGAVTRHSYDGERHLTRIGSAGGRTTEFTWGGYHKLCGRQDANHHEVTFRYNLEGELVELQNEARQLHRLEHDGRGHVIREVSFDGRELRYQLDPAGRIVRSKNGDREATDFTYDLAGQLVARERSDGNRDSFSYNLRGELVAASGPTSKFEFERDAMGRVVREIQLIGGDQHWVQSLYNAAGERVGRSTSFGHTESVQRDAMGGRQRTVLDGKHVITHVTDRLGRETAQVLPGGGRILSTFDTLGRLSKRRAVARERLTEKGNGEPGWSGIQERFSADVAYRYDIDGELVESLDQRNGRTQYRYDPIGQLLQMIPEQARAELFRYDAAGNLHESEAEGREYGRGNRLLRKGDVKYHWDEHGRLTEKRVDRPDGQEIWRYSWNAAGLLARVERPDRTYVDFEYDPFARRTAKFVTKRGEGERDRLSVSRTRFVWDGDVLAHEIRQASGSLGDPVVHEKTYVFEDLGFAPMAHRERGTWFHYLNDPIGMPERLLDVEGEVAYESKRSAWGKTEESPGGRTNTRIRLLGQYEDEETELCYNRLRYYDPDTGRFVSPDPIGFEGGTNGYSYAINPLGMADPLGLKATDLPILRPGTPAWKKQVRGMKSPGKGRDCRVANKEDAELLLKEARGDLPRKGSAEDPYNKKGDKYKTGYEVHPNEEHSENAPHNNLPHVKWKDWSGGKKQGSSGHIFFG